MPPVAAMRIPLTSSAKRLSKYLNFPTGDDALSRSDNSRKSADMPQMESFESFILGVALLANAALMREYSWSAAQNKQ